jgi:hypothetical protein
MDPVDVLLEEYQTIRQEILASMNNRVSVLSFGLATIGAIFTASIAVSTASNYSQLSNLMLISTVPVVTGFILFMWLGEYQRMMRAGKFLHDLEDRINNASGHESLLTWEHYLKSRGHMRYPYNTTVMLLILISLVSASLGLAMLSANLLTKAIIGGAETALHLATYSFAVRSINRLRQ